MILAIRVVHFDKVTKERQASQKKVLVRPETCAEVFPARTVIIEASATNASNDLRFLKGFIMVSVNNWPHTFRVIP